MDPESPPRELELSALEAEKEPMAAAAEPEPGPGSPPQAPPPHRDPSPAPGAEKNGLVMKIPPEEEEEAALGGSGVSGSPKFTGLGKEELLREAGTPLWARARLVLLVLFWGGWLGMLGAAAAIVAQAPRCQPLPAKAWWELGALYRAPPKAFGENLKGVEQRLGYLKEKLQVGGLVLGPLAPQKRPEDPIPPLKELDPTLGTPQDLSALLQAAKDKGLKVILDLTPNPAGDRVWGDAAADPKVHLQVQDALSHWLKEDIAGIFLDGIEELPPSVVAEWRNLTEENPSPSGVARVLVGGTRLPEPQLVPAVPGGLRLLLGPFLQPLVPNPALESPEGALRNLLSFLSSDNASVGGLGWSVGSPWQSWAPPELRLPQLLLLWGLPGTPVLSYGDELGLPRPPKNQPLPEMPWASIEEPKKGGNGSEPPELELCTALASLRAHERSLLLGEALPVRAGSAVALLRRWDQSERFLLLLNPHGSPLRPFSVQRDPEEPREPALPEWATLRFSTGPRQPGEPQVQLQELKAAPCCPGNRLLPEVTRRKRKRRHEAAHPQPAELPRAGAAARGRIPPQDRGRRGSGPPGAVQRRLRVPDGAAAALGRAQGGGGELGAPLGAAPRAQPGLRGRRGIPAPPPPRPARGGGAGGVPAVPGLGAALPHLQGGPKSAPERGRGLRRGRDPPKSPRMELSPSPPRKSKKTPNFHGFTTKNGARISPHVEALRGVV